MTHLMFSPTGSLRPSSVALAGVALSALALTVNLFVAEAAPTLLGDARISRPGLGKLMLATLPAVLGNTLGFYLSYRAPHPQAVSKFLLPAAAFFVLFMLPALWALLMGSGLGTFAAAALVNIVPVAIAVPILLGLRPAAARRPFTSARVNTGA